MGLFHLTLEVYYVDFLDLYVIMYCSLKMGQHKESLKYVLKDFHSSACLASARQTSVVTSV